MDDINSHATTYTGMQTREAQNSKMLYHFLMNSVTTEFTTKLVLYQEDYMINGAWGVSFQEDHSAHICGHHGHCFTYLWDLDGYAPETTYLPAQYQEVQ